MARWVWPRLTALSPKQHLFWKTPSVQPENPTKDHLSPTHLINLAVEDPDWTESSSQPWKRPYGLNQSIRQALKEYQSVW